MVTWIPPAVSHYKLLTNAGGKLGNVFHFLHWKYVLKVQLKTPISIEAVAVSINLDVFQHFTIFVIELLKNSKALYKPCSMFEGFFKEPRAVFLCNGGEGHFGQFVYIKDERVEPGHLGLCEVQVFPFRSEFYIWCLYLELEYFPFR